MKYKLVDLNDEFKAIVTDNAVAGPYALCAIITAGYAADAYQRFIMSAASLCNSLVKTIGEDGLRVDDFYAPIDALTESICMAASISARHDFEGFRKNADNFAIVRVDTKTGIYDGGIAGPGNSKFAKSFLALMQEKYPTADDFMSMLKENTAGS